MYAWHRPPTAGVSILNIWSYGLAALSYSPDAAASDRSNHREVSSEEMAWQPLGDLVDALPRVLHDAARSDHRQHRDPQHDPKTERVTGRGAVGRQRLRARHGRTADHRRPAG